TNICLNLDLASNAREQSFLASHDVHLAWPTGESGAIASIFEILDRVLQGFIAGEARDAFLLKDSAAHFLAHSFARWGFRHAIKPLLIRPAPGGTPSNSWLPPHPR